MSRFRFCLRDGRRSTSETRSSWDRVPHRAPGASRLETPTDLGRGVARISTDYRPQLPVVGKDIPKPAVLCHVGTVRLEEAVNIRTRSVGHAVRRLYSDSEKSDNDVLYAEEHISALQQVNLWKEWSTQKTVDSCGEGCAQLDDFKWFLPTDERAGDLSAPESEIKTSDSESGVDFIEPDSTLLQMETTAQQCPGDCVGDVMSGRRTMRWRWIPDKCPPPRIQ